MLREKLKDKARDIWTADTDDTSIELRGYKFSDAQGIKEQEPCILAVDVIKTTGAFAIDVDEVASFRTERTSPPFPTMAQIINNVCS